MNESDFSGSGQPSSHIGVFGRPLPELAEVAQDAHQFSPLIPGASTLEDVPPGSMSGFTMAAVPGTLERRYDLALMLRALAPDAPFTVLAPKDMGGARLSGELAAFGCTIDERAKRHHRICTGRRPAVIEGADAALSEGGPRLLEELGLWSQPGIFSWNRVDAGTLLLLDSLPVLSGSGADLGCGNGVLAHGVLASDDVRLLHLVDTDRRAIEAARRNVNDPRAQFAWASVSSSLPFEKLDFVVTNPPFHAAGSEDKGLGTPFIEKAASLLRTGGSFWMVANRHLPYERALKTSFRRTTAVTEAHGFKVLSAQK